MKRSNIQLLIAHKMSMDAIPPTTPSGAGFAAGLAFLADSRRVLESARAAQAWVAAALALVRQAPDPNPWRDADDETIAGEVLRTIAARKRALEAAKVDGVPDS